VEVIEMRYMGKHDYGYPYGNPMVSLAFLSAMTRLADKYKKEEAERTPEERQIRDERYKKLREERERKRHLNECILKNICPSGDGGKLVRGKKYSKNGYKRPWVCSKCGTAYFKED
jgi:hypothetical protein